MFTSPFLRPGTIISDSGFTITLAGRYQLTYDEPGLTASLNYDAGKIVLDLLTHSLLIFNGGNLLTLNEEVRRRILLNVSQALEWKGYTVYLVGSS